MVVRRVVATIAFGGLLSAPSFAAAQAFTWNPTVTLAAGYAASQVSYIDGRDPLRQAGPFASLGPALALTYETPRTAQALQMSVGFVVPLARDFTFYQAPFTYNPRANYTNHIELSELWNLNLGFSFSALPVNPFVTTLDAYDTPLEAVPEVFSYNLGLSAVEALTREISPSTRVIQTTNFTYNFPYDVNPIQATTLIVRNSLAWTHNWAVDALTATLTVSYSHFGLSEGSTADPRGQFLNTLVATWYRPLTPWLTSSVDFGVLQAASPDAVSGQLWQPTGGARLSYTFNAASVTLGYTHAAVINVFTATVNLSDQIALRATLPLSDVGLGLSGSTGYTRTSLVGIDGSLGRGADVYVTDLGLSFAPPVLPKLVVSARGTFSRQIPVYDPFSTETPSGFTRLSVNVNLGFAFPNARAAALQNQIAPAYVPTPTLGSDGTRAPGIQPNPIELIDAPAPGDPEPPDAPAPTRQAAPAKP